MIEVLGTIDPNRHSQMDIMGVNGLMQTLDTIQERKKIGIPIGGGEMKIGNCRPSGRGMNGEIYDSNSEGPSLTTNKGEGSKIAIPVLTPERAEKRQNGRRFKEDGEEAFTLTTQDIHGVAVDVKEATKTGYSVARGGEIVSTSHDQEAQQEEDESG